MKPVTLLTGLFLVSLVVLFPGMLSGRILHNCVYKYHFEPWAHHKHLIGAGIENPIISDSIDGADANMSPQQVSLFTLGERLQAHKLVTNVLMEIFSFPTALSITYWLTFALCFFSIYYFLNAWGVVMPLNLALSIGFTFGATNNHFYAYGTLTAFGVACFWFLEKLIRTGDLKWFILLTFALINLGGAEMVHVVVFFSFALLTYAIFRIGTTRERRRQAFLSVLLSFASSLVLSSDYIYSTTFHYIFNFEKAYRETYGVRQNSPISFATLFFSRIFGDPILEQRRWPGGTFLTTSLFIGSLAAFSLATLPATRKWPPLRGGFMFFLTWVVVALLYQYSLPFEHFELLLATIPPFKWVPPLYFKPVFQFFLVVLAAFGLTSIYQGGLATPRRKGLAVALMTIFLSCALGVFAHFYAKNGPSDWTLKFFKEAFFFVFITFVCVCVLIFGNTTARRASCICLVICAVLEARVHTRGWFPEALPSSCYPRTAVTDYLITHNDGARLQGLGRAAIPAIISPHTYGLEMAAGRMSVPAGLAVLLRQADPGAYQHHPSQYLFSENTLLDHPIWDLLNVRFFIARKSFADNEASLYHAKSRLAFHRLTDGTVIERTLRSQPALFRTNWVVAQNEEEMADIFKGKFDWSTCIIVDPVTGEMLPQPPRLGAAEGDMLGEIRDFKRMKNSLTLKVHQNTAGFWIISERWSSLWEVKVDGEVVKPIRAFFSLMGTQVPAGEHVIQLNYRLPGLRTANYLTGAGTLAFFGGILSAAFRRRRLRANIQPRS